VTERVNPNNEAKLALLALRIKELFPGAPFFFCVHASEGGTLTASNATKEVQCNVLVRALELTIAGAKPDAKVSLIDLRTSTVKT